LADLRTHPTELRVVIAGGELSTTMLQAPADTPFRITLENRDPGIPHGLAIQRGAPVDGIAISTEDLFEGEIFSGPASQTYEVPPMAPGVYTFDCLVHPSMVGTLVVR
jgi:plastocyanin